MAESELSKHINKGDYMMGLSTENSVQKHLDILIPLLEKLKKAKSNSEKINILNSFPPLKEAEEQFSFLFTPLNINEDHTLALKAILALGQGPIIFQDVKALDPVLFEALLDNLVKLEKFYDTVGGIIGYHAIVLQLILENVGANKDPENGTQYLHPEGINLCQDDDQTHQAVRWGIEELPHMAEIYPIGGAGDRLMLVDEKTGEPLPVAQLMFCGYSLLEGLIRDLQAREYLYYKLFDRQILTPIALMTSNEKNNYFHIKRICNEKKWFGRPQRSFVFFTQFSVPVITKLGQWAVSEPLKLIMKPGGHGVMWKLGKDYGIFEILAANGRQKAIIRQINNPLAGVDNGLLALSGIGSHNNKEFGFASCPRTLKAAEGTDVVIERKTEEGFSYCLTNIEYTEFAKKGIEDTPIHPGSPYSAFPCNTNILYADLNAIEAAVAKNPLPGMIINMKTKFKCWNEKGEQIEIEGGRLETTMQNIADSIIEKTPSQLSKNDLKNLKSFITFNERRKTISVTKSAYKPGGTLLGTPEGSLYDLLLNNEELLNHYCHIKTPNIGPQDKYLSHGPSFLFHFHPGLGPLYEIIGQKIQGGTLCEGAELQLEIAELEMKNVEVDGSLLIIAENILGDTNEENRLQYSKNSGKCILKNVKVKNKGINRQASNIYWKNEVQRTEEMRILIQGNGEFYAENVIFDGDYEIEVPEGHKLTFYTENGETKFKLETLDQPSWYWKYSFDTGNKVKLSK